MTPRTETVVYVGKLSYISVTKHASLIERELGLGSSSILSIPHYSRAAASVHKRKPEIDRALVSEALRSATALSVERTVAATVPA